MMLAKTHVINQTNFIMNIIKHASINVIVDKAHFNILHNIKNMKDSIFVNLNVIPLKDLTLLVKNVLMIVYHLVLEGMKEVTFIVIMNANMLG